MPRIKTRKAKHISLHKKDKNTSRLEYLLNNISNNRRGLVKSDINLPARLMVNERKSSRNTINIKPQIYSKSISSSFSSTMHNGHIHSVGKEVINDSSKPYIQIAELHNGHLDKYIIPRNQSSKPSNSSNPSKPISNKKTKKIKKTKISKKTKTSKISKK